MTTKDITAEATAALPNYEAADAVGVYNSRAYSILKAICDRNHFKVDMCDCNGIYVLPDDTYNLLRNSNILNVDMRRRDVRMSTIAFGSLRNQQSVDLYVKEVGQIAAMFKELEVFLMMIKPDDFYTFDA